MTERDASQIDNPEVAHEHSDVNVRAILLAAGALVVVAIVLHLALFVMFRVLESRAERRAVREFPLADVEAVLPTPPRIQANPAQDMKALRAREEEILTSYGWVDEQKGIVRIPIDEAMKRVLERGLPVREGSAR